MARPTRIIKPGTIPIPKDMGKLSWKINHIHSGTTTELTDDFINGYGNLICTDGISSFTFRLDNSNGKYVGKLYEGDIIDIYYDYTTKSNLNTVRSRFYIDSIYDTFSDNGFEIDVDCRNAPYENYRVHFADTEMTTQFSGKNVLDCFLGDSGTTDSEGNYTNGILYQSSLKLKVYDTSLSTWNIYSDLTTTQKNTLKSLTTYDVSHYGSYVSKSRLNISKTIVSGTSIDFRIQYDSSSGDTYLMIFPSTGVLNSSEPVNAGQNLISLSRYGRDTTQEVNRFKQTGQSDGSLLSIYTSEDTTLQNALWIKDKSESNTNLTTYDDVQDAAYSNLEVYKQLPKTGTVNCCALPTLNPGDKINLSVPYIISDEVLIRSVNFTISDDIIFTLDLERREKLISDLFQERITATSNISAIDNLNGMRFARTFSFNESTGFDLTDCSVQNEVLKLDSGQTTAIAISPSIDSPENVDNIEIRIKGNQIWGCTFQVSNDGSTWLNYTLGTVKSLSTIGSNPQVRIILNESTSGVSPSFEKVCILWK